MVINTIGLKIIHNHSTKQLFVIVFLWYRNNMFVYDLWRIDLILRISLTKETQWIFLNTFIQFDSSGTARIWFQIGWNKRKNVLFFQKKGQKVRRKYCRRNVFSMIFSSIRLLKDHFYVFLLINYPKVLWTKGLRIYISRVQISV